MPQLTTQRFFITLFSTLALSFVGVVAGYTTGNEIIIRSTQPKLARYANSLMARAEASSSESRTILQQMNASSFPFCSDQELTFLRKLAFQSEYLKELARVQGGKVVCTAMLNRLPHPLPLPKPALVQKDGTQVYLHLPPFLMNNHDLLVLQLRESFVVFRPHTLTDLDAPPFHYSITVPEGGEQHPVAVLGNRLHITPELVSKNGSGRSGNILYATRCSGQFFNCLVAYTTVPEIVQINRSTMSGFIIMGALVGLGFGSAFVLLYFRQISPKQKLQRAIREDKLHLVYQPVIHLSDQRLMGAEALVRWTDRDGCAQNPEAFVKLAEESGLICSLTERVLSHAIRDMGETLNENPWFQLNININAADLGNPQFASLLRDYLQQANVSPNSIGLELTERSAADRSIAINAILTLRSQGYRIFIDDFGTGYSSLSYLHELAVDAIKIDSSFTNAICTEAVIGSILPQILEMAKSLNLKVVVEGIETEEQAAYFRDNFPEACAQGWLFGRPVSAEEFRKIYLSEEEKMKAIGA